MPSCHDWNFSNFRVESVNLITILRGHGSTPLKRRRLSVRVCDENRGSWNSITVGNWWVKEGRKIDRQHMFQFFVFILLLQKYKDILLIYYLF